MIIGQWSKGKEIASIPKDGRDGSHRVVHEIDMPTRGGEKRNTAEDKQEN